MAVAAVNYKAPGSTNVSSSKRPNNPARTVKAGDFPKVGHYPSRSPSPAFVSASVASAAARATVYKRSPSRWNVKSVVAQARQLVAQTEAPSKTPSPAPLAASNTDSQQAKPSAFSEVERTSDEFRPMPPTAAAMPPPPPPAALPVQQPMQPAAGPNQPLSQKEKDELESQKRIAHVRSLLPPQTEAERADVALKEAAGKRAVTTEKAQHLFKDIHHLRAHTEFRKYGFNAHDILLLRDHFNILIAREEPGNRDKKWCELVEVMHRGFQNIIRQHKKPLLFYVEKGQIFYRTLN